MDESNFSARASDFIDSVRAHTTVLNDESDALRASNPPANVEEAFVTGEVEDETVGDGDMLCFSRPFHERLIHFAKYISAENTSSVQCAIVVEIGCLLQRLGSIKLPTQLDFMEKKYNDVVKALKTKRLIPEELGPRFDRLKKTSSKGNLGPQLMYKWKDVKKQISNIIMPLLPANINELKSGKALWEAFDEAKLKLYKRSLSEKNDKNFENKTISVEEAKNVQEEITSKTLKDIPVAWEYAAYPQKLLLSAKIFYRMDMFSVTKTKSEGVPTSRKHQRHAKAAAQQEETEKRNSAAKQRVIDLEEKVVGAKVTTSRAGVAKASSSIQLQQNVGRTLVFDRLSSFIKTTAETSEFLSGSTKAKLQRKAEELLTTASAMIEEDLNAEKVTGLKRNIIDISDDSGTPNEVAVVTSAKTSTPAKAPADNDSVSSTSLSE